MLNNKGFTLIELLVSMSILSLIIILTSNFMVSVSKSNRFGNEQEQAVTNARRAIDITKKEIRGANSSEQGDYPLSIIENDNFSYYSDIDNDGEMEKVRYYLNGTNLIKEITEPGLTGDYSGTPSTMNISHYMNNQEENIFTYFDRNYNETSVINEIRLVNIRLKINVTPDIAPNDYYVETDVTLRNLKDNL